MPKVSITQTAPIRRDLATVEDIDLSKYRTEDMLTAYNAYTAAGSATGEVVYVNYGRPEDFAALAKLGVSVTGKIALARYGKNFRGVKPDQAAKAGAIGMIIYSDPGDDGANRGDVYPEGPWRPGDAIQRGSVLKIWEYPGDPLTPGVPSLPGVARLAVDAAKSLQRIPVTPVSADEARELVKGLRGIRVPGKDWQGGYDFGYRLGDGAGGTRVTMTVDVGYAQTPARNVIVTVPGSDPDAGYVLIGGHRDTWGPGNSDNQGGWLTTMETARALGALYRDGWRPRRSIVLAGWDGEEHGLLGSTEYAEAHADQLRKDAIAYLNLDGATGRSFGADGVPSLDAAIRSVAAMVDDPGGKGSVLQAWTAASKGRPTVGRMGSGSDYSAFLHHLGVPAVGMGFSSSGGLYHSLYDNHDSTLRFADPGWKSMTASAELTGVLALRLANADVLPMKYSAYANETATLLEAMKAKAPAAGLDAAIAAAREWAGAARRLESYGARISAGGLVPGERAAAAKINAALSAQERALTGSGLPSRTWYKHLLWAPGMTTGYAVLPLPALAEAAELRDAAAFTKAAKDLTAALTAARKLAEGALPG